MKFRKYVPKTIPIEAVRISSGNIKEIVRWLNEHYGDKDHLWYSSFEKVMLDDGWRKFEWAREGDWVIKRTYGVPVVWPDWKMMKYREA